MLFPGAIRVSLVEDRLTINLYCKTQEEYLIVTMASVRRSTENLDTGKDDLYNPHGFLVNEKIANVESREGRVVAHDIRRAISALELMSCKWNAALMQLLLCSGWEFVSALLVEMYQLMGRRVIRRYIDVPMLIGDISRSSALVKYIEPYKTAGIHYAVDIIEIVVDSLIAGFISRYQFMAVVKHVTGVDSAFISITETPLDISTVVVDKILTAAALSKSRFQSEFVSMVSLIEYDLPWISDRDSYRVFFGHRKLPLKRKRVQWEEDGIIGIAPEKRLCVNTFSLDDYFSDSLPSDEVISDHESFESVCL